MTRIPFSFLGGMLVVTVLVAPLHAAGTSRVPAVESPAAPSAVLASAPSPDEAQPCHWWRRGRCETGSLEGLPPDAPQVGTLITVDTSTNTLYLFREGQLVAKGPVATGTEKTLTRGLQVWMFHTPRGRMKVLRKINDPVWRKPDWAFVEQGERIPPPDSPRRLIKGHLGKHALDLGDGIMIHGTDEIDSLGRKASHGCVRVGHKLLKQVFDTASIGTDVFIF